ncbi:MAG: hypothetical protein NC081_06660 [Roseburia sp.]|nr:hypothetical protein [Roseburia sp.]
MRIRGLNALLFAALLWISACLPAHAARPGETAMPMYDIAASVTATLTFSGTTATCKASVKTTKTSSEITGVMALVDTTNGTCLASWQVSGTGGVNPKQTVSNATKGHTYTLTFTGVVKNGTKSENVSASDTKKC